MGGKIWETPETRIYDDGVAKGRAEGLEQGRAEMAEKIEAVEFEIKRKDKENAALRKKIASLEKQIKSKGAVH